VSLAYLHATDISTDVVDIAPAPSSDAIVVCNWNQPAVLLKYSTRQSTCT